MQEKNGHILLPHPDGPDEQLVSQSNKLLLLSFQVSCRRDP